MSEDVTRDTLKVLEQGKSLDQDVPLCDSPKAESFARDALFGFVEDTGPPIARLIEASLNSSLRSLDPLLRWFDQMHVRANSFELRDVSPGENHHRWLFPGMDPVEQFFLEHVVWETWYDTPDRSLSLTPLMFHASVRGGLITNDPSITEHAGKTLGLTVWNVADTIKSLVTETALWGVWSSRIDNVSDLVNRQDKLSLLGCSSTKQMAVQLDEYAAGLESSAIESVPDVLLDSAKTAGIGAEFSTLLSRYLIATWLYEQRAVGIDNRYFYYLYLPYLPRVANVMAGTAIGFQAKSFAQEDNNIEFQPSRAEELIGRLSAVNSLWAQFPVQIQSRRTMVVSASRSARAAIMSRNLSHNIGSHALASPSLFRQTGLTKKELTETESVLVRAKMGAFHHYLQSRLDFIARAMHEHVERTEPMFFVKDVLGGFLRQTVLLETMLRDLGYPSKDRAIEFSVDLGGKKATFKATREKDGSLIREARAYTRHDGEEADQLIGMPGGSTACQGLYSFLENVMRNAAKYGEGSSSNRPLSVNLRLRAAQCCDVAPDMVKRFWLVEISDSLTNPTAVIPNNRKPKGRDDVHTVVDLIRYHLDHEAIYITTGAPREEGLGLQDMKFSADLLANGGEFLADSEVLEQGADCVCEYCKYLNTSAKRVASPETRSATRPLRAYASQSGELTYQLLLPRARLLGVVAFGGGGTGLLEHDATIEYFKDVASFARQADGDSVSGSAFGVILDDGEETTIDAVLDEVGKCNDALPYRLMVLSDERRSKEWRTALEQGLSRPKPIHPRRLCVVTDAALYDIFAGKPFAPNIEFQGTHGWPAVLLRTFHLWLFTKHKARNNTWRLAVGFQREAGQAAHGWTALCDFGDVGPDGTALEVTVLELTSDAPHEVPFCEVECCGTTGYISVGAMSNQKSLDKMMVLREAANFHGTTNDAKSKYIIYDNHGKCWQGGNEGAAFYQTFSNSTLNLFQTLESPPTESFALAWFLYSVAEASLTRVAVVDERVVEASDGDERKKFNDARVHPLAYFDLKASRQWVKVCPKKEVHQGLRLDNEVPLLCEASNSRGLLQEAIPNNMSNGTSFEFAFDVVVVHEGVADCLKDDLAKILESKLRSFAPRFIRTSGRGAKARHLAPESPFLEFSELSDSVFRSPNKPSLGRAVTGVSGRLGKV